MKEIDEEYLEELAILKASKHKQEILKVLADENIKIPSEIRNISNLKTNQISLNLKELKDLNMVKCLNENKKKGRLYRITDKGTTLLKFL